MDQDYFRRLVSAPVVRPAPAVSGGNAKGDADAAASGEKKKRDYRPKPKPKQKGKDAADEHVPSASYRDRAAERRTTRDGEDDETMVKNIDYTRSKFLGGDLAHTHLVKGLDFALLQKIRSEMEEGESAAVDAELESVMVGKVSAKAKTAGAAAAAVASSSSAPEAVSFTTAFGAQVFRAAMAAEKILRESTPDAAKRRSMPSLDAEFVAHAAHGNVGGSRFAPGRTTFEVTLPSSGSAASSAADSDAVPTLIVRSKEDVPPCPPALADFLDPELLDQLRNALIHNDKRRKPSAAPAPSSSSAAAIVASTGAISGPSASRFVPAATAAKTTAVTKSSPVRGSDNDDDDIFSGAGRYDTVAASAPSSTKTGGDSSALLDSFDSIPQEAGGFLRPHQIDVDAALDDSSSMRAEGPLPPPRRAVRFSGDRDDGADRGGAAAAAYGSDSGAVTAPYPDERDAAAVTAPYPGDVTAPYPGGVTAPYPGGVTAPYPGEGYPSAYVSSSYGSSSYDDGVTAPYPGADYYAHQAYTAAAAAGPSYTASSAYDLSASSSAPSIAEAVPPLSEAAARARAVAMSTLSQSGASKLHAATTAPPPPSAAMYGYYMNNNIGSNAFNSSFPGAVQQQLQQPSYTQQPSFQPLQTDRLPLPPQQQQHQAQQPQPPPRAPAPTSLTQQPQQRHAVPLSIEAIVAQARSAGAPLQSAAATSWGVSASSSSFVSQAAAGAYGGTSHSALSAVADPRVAGGSMVRSDPAALARRPARADPLAASGGIRGEGMTTNYADPLHGWGAGGSGGGGAGGGGSSGSLAQHYASVAWDELEAEGGTTAAAHRGAAALEEDRAGGGFTMPSSSAFDAAAASAQPRGSGRWSGEGGTSSSAPSNPPQPRQPRQDADLLALREGRYDSLGEDRRGALTGAGGGSGAASGSSLRPGRDAASVFDQYERKGSWLASLRKRDDDDEDEAGGATKARKKHKADAQFNAVMTRVNEKGSKKAPARGEGEE